MRRRWSALALLAALACAGSGAGKEISVGGTYQTTVTMLESTCSDMGIQQQPTTVAHQPGDTALTVIMLTGSFTIQALDIRADVEAGRQPPCHIAARWSGPKDGPPNVLP